MKELNKLIELPVYYEDSGQYIRDAAGNVIAEIYGTKEQGEAIAHTLNNLNSENHAISRNSDNLQTKGNPFMLWLEQRFGSAEVDVIIQDAARWNSLREEYKKHLDKPKAKCSERCDWPNCTLDGCRQREIDPDWNLQPKEGEFYCAYGCKEPCKECEEAAVSGEAQLGAWTTEAQKEAAKGRALIDDITPEAQMRRENK